MYVNQPALKVEIKRLFETYCVSCSCDSAARVLGVSRNLLWDCLYGIQPISIDMALRFSAAFDIPVENLFTIGMQSDYQKGKPCMNELQLERIKSYFENLRCCKAPA